MKLFPILSWKLEYCGIAFSGAIYFLIIRMVDFACFLNVVVLHLEKTSISYLYELLVTSLFYCGHRKLFFQEQEHCRMRSKNVKC